MTSLMDQPTTTSTPHSLTSFARALRPLGCPARLFSEQVRSLIAAAVQYNSPAFQATAAGFRSPRGRGR